VIPYLTVLSFEPEAPSMNALIFLVETALNIVYWLVLIYVIFSLLVNFNVINLQNDLVRQIFHGINGLVEPLLAPIRRILPTTGGLDFSPLVLIILVIFLRKLIVEDFLPLLA